MGVGPDLAPHWPFQVGAGLHSPYHSGRFPIINYTDIILLMTLPLSQTSYYFYPTDQGNIENTI